MRRLTTLVFVALLATAAASTAAFGKGAAHKTTICHRADAHKYVAITVSNKALQKHVAHHSDVIGPQVPQNNKAAARTFCGALPILSPKQGGKKLKATFSNTLPGVSANLNVRLRPGQGQLCFNLDVTGSTVSAATVTVGATTVTLTPLPVAPATSSSGCVNVTRTLVKAMLKNPAGASISLTTGAGTLTGTLGKH